jgi:hypothetical protein
MRDMRVRGYLMAQGGINADFSCCYASASYLTYHLLHVRFMQQSVDFLTRPKVCCGENFMLFFLISSHISRPYVVLILKVCMWAETHGCEDMRIQASVEVFLVGWYIRKA